MGRLSAKRCLIVGGTSGIGLATARRFLEEGAKVLVVGLSDVGDASDLQCFGEVYCSQGDATRNDDVERWFHEVDERFGGLDVLYHVAGASGRKFGDGPLHECTDDGWDATVTRNLKGPFLTNRRAIRGWLEKKQPGVILNMASVLASDPSPRYFDTAAYAASKGGVVALSLQAAARYAKGGIRVNVLAPGLIDTPMAQRACGDPAILKFLETKQPLRRGPGRVEDCTEPAVFLCSDEARFVTGVVLPVDGGWRLSDGQYGEPTPAHG